MSFELKKHDIFKKIENYKATEVYIILLVNYIENNLIVEYYQTSQHKKKRELWDLEETIQGFNELRFELVEFKKFEP